MEESKESFENLLDASLEVLIGASIQYGEALRGVHISGEKIRQCKENIIKFVKNEINKMQATEQN